MQFYVKGMLYSLLRMISKAILYLNKFHSPFLSILGKINVQWIKESVNKILPFILVILFTSVKSPFFKKEEHILARIVKRQETGKLQGKN